MAAASLQALTPDRDVMLGIGVSSPVVAGHWHGAAYPGRPFAQMLRKFRLGVDLVGRRPKIIVGALGEEMLRLAGELADGGLLNYVPASHVPWCVEQVRRGGSATIYANVHVGVGDQDAAIPQARAAAASEAPVPGRNAS
jgi:alkanesulfonate monooxygenase SsuD/methylene tetrahydromethanopterin reductase-like flavin-dependent oxidoreductase (luciferase family)